MANTTAATRNRGVPCTRGLSVTPPNSSRVAAQQGRRDACAGELLAAQCSVELSIVFCVLTAWYQSNETISRVDPETPCGRVTVHTHTRTHAHTHTRTHQHRKVSQCAFKVSKTKDLVLAGWLEVQPEHASAGSSMCTGCLWRYHAWMFSTTPPYASLLRQQAASVIGTRPTEPAVVG